MNTRMKLAVFLALASQIFHPVTAQASNNTPVTSVNLGTLIDRSNFSSNSAGFGFINSAPGNTYNSPVEFSGQASTLLSNGSLNTQTISAPTIDNSFDLALTFTSQSNATLTSTGGMGIAWGGTLNSVELLQNNVLVATAHLTPFSSGIINSWTYSIDPTALYVGDTYTLDLQGTGAWFGLGEIQGTIDIVNVSAVPVPAAVWLFSSSIVGFIGFNRRKSV